jgi:two-component system, NarL family, invasion response regulator UvrY
MKVLICDDHKLLRASLRKILELMPEVEFIGEAADGKEALNMLEETDYDTLLLDINMPGLNGMEVLKLVKERKLTVNVLMLSMHPEEQYAMRAIKMGASGYLTKNIDIEELFGAIRKVSDGGLYITKELEKELADKLNKDHVKSLHENLSQREFSVMLHLAQGENNVQIGEKLNISHKTISTYKSRILSKMECKNNIELTRYCIEHKLI